MQRRFDMVRKLYKYGLLSVALTTTLAVLAGPAKTQIAAGFYENGSSGVTTGFSWNVDTNAVATASNGSGGSNTIMFGVSPNAKWFVGVADDSSGLFHGAAWNGVNGAATTPVGGFFESGAS